LANVEISMPLFFRILFLTRGVRIGLGFLISGLGLINCLWGVLDNILTSDSSNLFLGIGTFKLRRLCRAAV
jgi:hypothetical protein